MSSNKRQRTFSGSRLSLPSQSTSKSLSPEPEPMYKSSRTAEETTGDRRLLCTLPPTCNPPHNRPTPIANSRDLELHYGKYHAQVCEQKGCGFVFPDARLLELHQTECHDPLAAVRKDRGDKIFACHLVSCPRLFQTPKARRLHLIQAHSYPKEYFFAVTNKGVGGLLKRWGDGASMIRGTWKPRDNKNEKDSEDDEMVIDEDEEDSDEGENEESSSGDEQNGEATPKIRYHQELEEIPTRTAISPRRGNGAVQTAADHDIDKLTNSINSLSLVPPSIRFGRGGKNGGFVHPEMHNPQVSKFNPHAFGPRGGRGRARIATAVHPRAGSHNAQIGAPRPSTEVDVQPVTGPVSRGAPPRGRAGVIHVGRGFRGRGRGS
ncbi:uncharacterized protein EDB93DRAFT_568363 [Suillus bovinus]|uniref:uncharacterized protein n=1 Tax=Suillus bovinus TaxID=48563 RepID=UPI001B880872|nr:uncharacterized protein EDB93DRAFT_568363 [Suillus bovinus]KAG2143775.1 hypothetical protein EDB93DRAFT_568363 [Suillus bovinus]